MENNKPTVVILDHFDSFTYNLAVAFENLGATVQVFRTKAAIDEIVKAKPTHIVLSPGPGHPKDVTLFQSVLEDFKGKVPILGVCLGHQAIGLHFGAMVEKNKTVIHGKTSSIIHSGLGIFEDVSANPIQVCRYHSLVIVEKSIPFGTLLQTAWSEDGTIMGIESVKYPTVVGVQFHPESLFTEQGGELLQNFLKMENARLKSYPC